jgi:hypothetical protein
MEATHIEGSGIAVLAQDAGGVTTPVPRATGPLQVSLVEFLGCSDVQHRRMGHPIAEEGGGLELDGEIARRVVRILLGRALGKSHAGKK